MVKENPYYVKNIDKLPETYTVSYFNEVEWNKNLTQNDLEQQKIINASYHAENQAEERGYGPCKNSLCGCNCSSSTCICSSSSAWVEGSGTGFSASGRASGGNMGGQASSSLFSHRDGGGEIRALSSSVGGNIGVNGAGIKLGIDAVNMKSDGIQARIGLNVDTGVSTDNGLEVKAAGFGFSVGKQTGISTPFGEVKVDTDDCVIQ